MTARDAVEKARQESFPASDVQALAVWPGVNAITNNVPAGTETTTATSGRHGAQIF